MTGPLLTTASIIMCPHGGMATLKTKNTTTSAGARVLLESDIHDVFGCTFTVGPNYRPCEKIKWSAGARAVKVHNTKVLDRSSVGTCRSREGIVQGVALITPTQLRAKSG